MENEKTSTVIKLDPKVHKKGKVDAAKQDKTVADIYADIITNYYKGRK